MVAVRALFVLLAACGRVGFDGAVGREDAGGDDAELTPACPAFAVLCDDFETGDVSRWTQQEVAFGGSLVVQQAIVHGGSFAMDATIGPQAGTGAYVMVVHERAVQSTGVISMRAWLYAPITLTDFESVMSFFHEVPTVAYVTVGVDAGTYVVTESSTSGGLVDHYTSAIGAVAAWQCIEMLYDLDARNVVLYVDDAKVLDVAMQDPAPAYSRLSVGVTRADLDGTRAVVDDVVIADRRIGCQ